MFKPALFLLFFFLSLQLIGQTAFKKQVIGLKGEGNIVFTEGFAYLISENSLKQNDHDAGIAVIKMNKSGETVADTFISLLPENDNISSNDVFDMSDASSAAGKIYISGSYFLANTNEQIPILISINPDLSIHYLKSFELSRQDWIRSISVDSLGGLNALLQSGTNHDSKIYWLKLDPSGKELQINGLFEEQFFNALPAILSKPGQTIIKSNNRVILFNAANESLVSRYIKPDNFAPFLLNSLEAYGNQFINIENGVTNNSNTSVSILDRELKVVNSFAISDFSFIDVAISGDDIYFLGLNQTNSRSLQLIKFDLLRFKPVKAIDVYNGLGGFLTPQIDIALGSESIWVHYKVGNIDSLSKIPFNLNLSCSKLATVKFEMNVEYIKDSINVNVSDNQFTNLKIEGKFDNLKSELRGNCFECNPPVFELQDEYVICEGESLPIEIKTGTSIKWSTGNTGFKEEFSQPGDYWVKAINACGNDSHNFKVVEKPKPGIETGLRETHSIETFEPIKLTTLAEGYCFWRSIDTVVEGKMLDLIFEEPGKHLFELKCNTGFYCEDSIEFTIKVGGERVHFPNAFSPNGDGLNDYFKPHGFGFEIISMKVFNRWGQIVHEGNTAWDGRVKGRSAPQGVYHYIIQFKTQSLQNNYRFGEINLIK